MLNHLDLCSGIGGFALGFEWANLSKPMAFCDTDEWCQKVLAKNFPNIVNKMREIMDNEHLESQIFKFEFEKKK